LRVTISATTTHSTPLLDLYAVGAEIRLTEIPELFLMGQNISIAQKGVQRSAHQEDAALAKI